MTAPIRTPPPLDPYRVILDYEALEDMFLDRIEDLNVPFHEIDVAGDFALGNVQKLLSKSRERWARTLGIESFGKMLKGTGMVLIAYVDDERFAEIKAQLVQRRRKPSIVGQTRPKWLFTPKKAREMRLKWWSSLTPAQQKKHQRKAQRGQAAARRRKARLLLANGLPPQLGKHGGPITLNRDIGGPMGHELP